MSQPLHTLWSGRLVARSAEAIGGSIGRRVMHAKRRAVAFVRCGDGAATIEHVMILTVVLAVAGGAVMLSDGINRVTIGFSQRLDDGPQGTKTAGSETRSASADENRRVELAATPGGLWRWCIPAIGLAVAGIAGWNVVASRRGKKRLKATLDQSLQSLTALEQSRLFAKRQHLLRVLTHDKSLLLENRVQVRHLMTRDVVAVSPNAGLEEMVQVMEEHCLRHLLVQDKQGHLLGVVSDRDISQMRGKNAKQLISPVPMTVAHDTPIGPAITYLIDKGISCLPVLEDGSLGGVLTTTDLVMTLQCALQLWVPVAETMNQSARWTEEELDAVIGTACTEMQN